MENTKQEGILQSEARGKMKNEWNKERYKERIRIFSNRNFIKVANWLSGKKMGKSTERATAEDSRNKNKNSTGIKSDSKQSPKDKVAVKK